MGFWLGVAMGMADEEAQRYDTSRRKQYFTEDTMFDQGEHVEHMIRGLKVIDKELSNVVLSREKMSEEEFKKERARLHWFDQLINMDLKSWDEHFPGWRTEKGSEPYKWFYTMMIYAYTDIGLVFGRDILFEDAIDKKGRTLHCIQNELELSYDVCEGKPYVSFYNFSSFLASSVLSATERTLGEDVEVKSNTFTYFQRKKEYLINELSLESKEYRDRYIKRYESAKTLEELTNIANDEALESYLPIFEKFGVPKDVWKPIYNEISDMYANEPYANPWVKRKIRNKYLLLEKIGKKYKEKNKN